MPKQQQQQQQPTAVYCFLPILHSRLSESCQCIICLHPSQADNRDAQRTQQELEVVQVLQQHTCCAAHGRIAATCDSADEHQRALIAAKPVAAVALADPCRHDNHLHGQLETGSTAIRRADL